MKEICFGIAVGMAMGLLVAVNCENVRSAVKDGQSTVTKKFKQAKKALNEKKSNRADDSDNEEFTDEED